MNSQFMQNSCAIVRIKNNSGSSNIMQICIKVRKGTECLPTTSPYNPNIAPSDYFLFPFLKLELWGFIKSLSKENGEDVKNYVEKRVFPEVAGPFGQVYRN